MWRFLSRMFLLSFSVLLSYSFRVKYLLRYQLSCAVHMFGPLLARISAMMLGIWKAVRRKTSLSSLCKGLNTRCW